MELAYLMLTGSLSGLLSVLGHSVVFSAVEALRTHDAHAAPTISPSVFEALLHMLSGMGLGLIFWLSWGLPAVVDVPWWVRGISFGSLCWLAFALPGVISAGLERGGSVAVVALLASRWATTCVIAGLACAWSWN